MSDPTRASVRDSGLRYATIDVLNNVGDLSAGERDWLRQLQSADGATLVKFGRRGSPRPKSFHITQDLRLSWKSSKLTRRRSDNFLSLYRVTRIQRGHTTQQFQRFENTDYGTKSKKSFSILYDSDLRSLDLMCIVGQDAVSLITLIEKLVAVNKNAHGEAKAAFYNYHWRQSDKDSSGALSLDEVVALVQRINKKMSRDSVKSMLRLVDRNSDGALQYDEFIHLMKLLTSRPEVESMWSYLLVGDLGEIERGMQLKQLSEEEKNQLIGKRLDVETFRIFLEKFQGERYTLEEVENLVEELEEEPEVRGSGLSFDAFLNYLSASFNEAFDPSREHVTSQMDHPLSHYWIATSHNTYLEGDQLQSSSSLNRYIFDLRSGCRCIEIDCWDGPDEPVVTHGHTLTTKILFSDVIQAIKEHAFSASEYPVIISLENHCSKPQQVRIAEILESCLGDMLTTISVSGGKLPSPEGLKGKIILKASTGKVCSSVFDACETIAEDSNEDKSSGFSSDEDEEDDSLESENDSDGGPSMRSIGRQGLLPIDEGTVKRAVVGSMKLVPELNRLTSLKGVKFKGFEQAKVHQNDYMSSFKEKKAKKLLKMSREAWVEHNQQKLSRIYPSGKRITSTNYNPMPHWCAGSQLVALNTQTVGLPMFLHHGKFRDNGGCGYVLKPKCLLSWRPTLLPTSEKKDITAEASSARHKISGDSPKCATSPIVDLARGTMNSILKRSSDNVCLDIWVWSAQQLPKPGGRSKGEIIDPYVKIRISGLKKESRMTEVVWNNGLNPVWGEKFTFQVQQASLALLTFIVWDKDSTMDEFIAFSSVPVAALRDGFRRVSLFCKRGTERGLFQYSSLLCQFKILSVP